VPAVVGLTQVPSSMPTACVACAVSGNEKQASANSEAVWIRMSCMDNEGAVVAS